MGKVVKFEPKQDREPYEGCPSCPAFSSPDGALYITHEVWCHCDKHKTTWCVGIDCSYTFPNPDSAEHQANENFLADYRVVDLDSKMTMREYYPNWYADPEGA